MQKSKIDITELAIQVVADKCRKSMFYFVQTFWDVIIQEQPIYNWHIPYLCEELQTLLMSVVRREPKLYDMIINIPPGESKTTIVSIMVNAWAWTVDPTLRIISNSYASELAIDAAMKTRDIILSDKYKKLFPYVQLRKDKSQKTAFANTLGGSRQTSSTGGAVTGRHAHLILNDDPQNPKQASSEIERAAAIKHLGTLSSRKVDPRTTPMIHVMQRLNEKDVTGYLMKTKGDKIRHICLPATLTDDVKPTELRANYIDCLFNPVRLTREVLDERLIDLGSKDYSGQMMQNPTPEGGNIIKNEWFGKISSFEFQKLHSSEPIVFWLDTAYTDNSNNDPSGILASCKIGNNVYFVARQKVYMKFPDLVRFVPQFARANGYTNRSTIRVEPKANGISVVHQLKEVTGLNVLCTKSPKDSKETRLNAVSPQIEAGRVILVGEGWDDYIDEVCGFPTKAHDEYVDLTVYAVDYHINSPYKPINKKKIARLIH
ncbi:MAG: phage terminase large subunit [Bacteroidales bacterium]